MDLTFLECDYIWQILTKGHDCPVPSMTENKFYATPSTLGGAKIHTIRKVSCQYFLTEISHANRGPMDMKQIKQDFSSKAWTKPMTLNRQKINNYIK